MTGEPTVLIGSHPAARVTDKLVCGPARDVIAEGSPTVLIGFQRAARIGDGTAHGGVIVTGEPTVLIGIPGQGEALMAASRSGVPFCEICDLRRKKALAIEALRRDEEEEEESESDDDAQDDEDEEPEEEEEHDGYFVVEHAGGGPPIKGLRYRITRASGGVVKGSTDGRGRTKLVETGPPELLTVEVMDRDELKLDAEDEESPS